MLQIPTYDNNGKSSGTVEIDPAILGTRVRPQLLKQAVVMYRANARQNTSATKSRGMVEGSTRKLYRQKGTGNARMGTRRTVVRKGGGVAFAKGNQNYDQTMNRKMRRLARNNAILAKIVSESAVVVDDPKFDSPSTKQFVSVMNGLGVSKGCVVAMGGQDDMMYRSGRNVAKTEVKPITELTAYDILRRDRFVMTRSAFDLLVKDPVTLNAGDEG